MSEGFTFRSQEGTEYECCLSDIIELDKKQRQKIRDQAANMTDQEIRYRGLEVVLGTKQGNTVVRRIKEITSHKSLTDILKSLVLFTPHAKGRMADPERSLQNAEEAVECLQSAYLASKCKIVVRKDVNTIPGSPVRTEPKLRFTIWGKKEAGTKLASLSIKILQRRSSSSYILVITVLEV